MFLHVECWWFCSVHQLDNNCTISPHQCQLHDFEMLLFIWSCDCLPFLKQRKHEFACAEYSCHKVKLCHVIIRFKVWWWILIGCQCFYLHHLGKQYPTYIIPPCLWLKLLVDIIDNVINKIFRLSKSSDLIWPIVRAWNNAVWPL